MKCPNCGNELKEGHLICEICGYEIQIVPDFEPEIENSITETLSTLAAMQDGEDTQPSLDEESIEEAAENEERTAGNRKTWVITSLIIIFAIVLLSYGTYAYHIQTVDYQINKAKEYAANEKYDEAIACLKEAYIKHPDLSLIHI